VNADEASLHARAWADVWELIDLQLSPLGLEAIRALSPASGDVVLDVGCGAGQTVLQLAERVGPTGRVIGADVASSLIEIAQRRSGELGQAELIAADAGRLNLADHSLDAVFSRFGVMGFDNPVAAFANFRRMLRPSGRLAFCCWRSLQENALDRLPLEAAGLSLSDDTPSASPIQSTYGVSWPPLGSGPSPYAPTTRWCRAAASTP
jgi:SAM-dependent methyltransferase